MTAIEKGRARCETAKSETGGFALVPGDVPVPDAETLQPADLRSAALHWLGRHPEPWPRLPVPVNRDGESIRVLTYNVHSCLGMDGKRSPRRIARVIAQCEPDIVALQELDVRRVRSGGRDQAHEISQELRMVFHFHPALRVEDERYGDALLSRHPLRLIHAGPLPGPPSGGAVEPRGALWGEVAIGGRPLQILTTHLGLSAAERQRQIETLLGDEWLPFGSTPRRPDWRFLQICTTESGIRGRSS